MESRLDAVFPKVAALAAQLAVGWEPRLLPEEPEEPEWEPVGSFEAGFLGYFLRFRVGRGAIRLQSAEGVVLGWEERVVTEYEWPAVQSRGSDIPRMFDVLRAVWVPAAAVSIRGSLRDAGAAGLDVMTFLEEAVASAVMES